MSESRSTFSVFNLSSLSQKLTILDDATDPPPKKAFLGGGLAVKINYFSGMSPADTIFGLLSMLFTVDVHWVAK